jgi:hypothetical protein
LDTLCGTYLQEYRHGISIPSPSSSLSDETSINVFHMYSAFPKRRLTTRGAGRRSSMMIYRPSIGHVDASRGQETELSDPNSGPVISDDEGDDGLAMSGMDFMCDADYGADDDSDDGGDRLDLRLPVALSLQGEGSAAPPSKIQWDSVFTDPKTERTSSSNDESVRNSIVNLLPLNDWTQSSYGYAPPVQEVNNSTDTATLTSQFTSLNLQASTSSEIRATPFPHQTANSWAGANHWKSKLSLTRQRAVAATLASTKASSGGKVSKKVKVTEGGKEEKEKKKKFCFDFENLSSEVSDQIDTTWENSGGGGKGTKSRRLDPRVLSQTVRQKMIKKARELMLPEDMKRDRRDLYRYTDLDDDTGSGSHSLDRLSQWDPLLVLPHHLSDGQA